MVENFEDKSNEIYELDPVYFVSVPGLAWQACLKKTGVKLELLTNYNMLFMVENGIRGGICQATHRYAKANNKYMKNYDKNIESSYLVFFFAWMGNVSNVLTRLYKKNDENSNTGYSLEVDVE